MIYAILQFEVTFLDIRNAETQAQNGSVTLELMIHEEPSVRHKCRNLELRYRGSLQS